MTRSVRSHEDLIVWQRAIQLIAETYRVSRLLPQDERFGVTAQVRRAAISIAANIAEGCGRGSRKDIAYFLVVARGSLRELETLLSVALELKFLTASDVASIRALSIEVGKMINALRKSLVLSAPRYAKH